MKRSLMVIIFSLLVMVGVNRGEAATFVAYSLGVAERQLGSGGKPDEQLTRLGGITHLAGMVYDDANKDLIIVGQSVEGAAKLSLDELVTALRAVLVHKAAPLVSIDRTQETPHTNLQKVRFEGGIENTQLGQAMLEADVVLKKLALGLVSGSIWGTQSYAAMTAQEAGKGALKDNITSRFWFVNRSPNLACRQGVFAILALDIGIETEVLAAEVDGKPVADLRTIRDKIGDNFASQVVANYRELSLQYPVLAQATGILGLVSLASGVDCIESAPNLGFWLHQYQPRRVDTPLEYPLLGVNKEITGRNMTLRVTGGMQFNPIVLRLQSGEVGALKEAVLKSRPGSNALVWQPPLEGWSIPGLEDQLAEAKKNSAPKGEGFTIDRLLVPRPAAGNHSTPALFRQPLAPFKVSSLTPSVVDRLPRQQVSSDVGGVMLSGVAEVFGTRTAQADLSNGTFSIVVGGQNALLAPEAFRKFVTALWAVYYSRTDPGISIDPIAPGVDKHLVRYIGKVINTDLGRVMREADYLMKKWAVGTERPAIQGFKNPDDIAAKRRVLYAGAWSRFWFVPEAMHFKQAGDMLLFDSGHMKVKTEFMMNNSRNYHADPANEEFARLFTEKYPQIAQQYPIYQELFEYAKLVSLAKFLKESHVPLFWFLLANQDLVLTEDSPGAVDALVKGSEHFRGVTVEGGVDLSPSGRYVFDQAALQAIDEAARKYATSPGPTTSTASAPKYVPASFSFEVGNHSYSVVPQHSLTSGKDRRGIRYQTDLALRAEGFELTPASLETLQAEIQRLEMAEKLQPELEKLEKNAKNMSESAQEADLERLYANAWKATSSKVEALVNQLASLVNHEYKVEADFAAALRKAIGQRDMDRLGNRIVRQAHYVTDLELVRYFNPQRLTEEGEFGKGWRLLIPYRIRPSGTAAREFHNILMPAAMEVESLLSGEKEILTFAEERYAVAGYVPDKLENSRFIGLFPLTDGSFRLADKIGNEFEFDAAGYLTELKLSEDHVIHVEYLDQFTDAFDRAPYQLELAGEERLAFAGALIPKRMRIKDLVHGTSEDLTFSKANPVAGYVPDAPDRSRYQILALLTDGSFQLLDTAGHEIAFTPAGEFRAMGPSAGNRRMVRAMVMGNHKITFGYTIDASGSMLIASASLSRDRDQAKPTYIVKYEYDNTATLVRAEGPANQKETL